jgi:hypothetical protein
VLAVLDEWGERPGPLREELIAKVDLISGEMARYEREKMAEAKAKQHKTSSSAPKSRRR